MKRSRLEQYDYGMVYAYTRREQDKHLPTGGWNSSIMKAARTIRDMNVAELTEQGFSALQISVKMGRGYSTTSVVRARQRLNVDVSHLKTSTKAFCKRGHRRPPGIKDCKPCSSMRSSIRYFEKKRVKNLQKRIDNPPPKS